MKLPEVSGGVTSIAKETILFMSKKGLYLTPNNYRIWFEYFRGSMAELKEALDKMMEENVDFNEMVNAQIYNKFLQRNNSDEDHRKIEAEIRAVDEANRASRAILKPIVKDLGGFSQNSSKYGDTLQDIVDEVAELEETENIENIVKRLMDETKAMSSENSRISTELKKSSKQLAELRENLEAARIEAKIDDLTGLPNRRAFNEKIAEEINRVKAAGNACMIMIDVDRFKRINDIYGHSVGDKALCAITEQINDALGSQDSLFRYGGEEFSVIMSDTSLKKAVKKMDKIRQEIENHEFTVRDFIEKITISIGVININPDGTSESNIERADNAMYLAKRSGRNNTKTEDDI